jgi:cyclohexa-1,5-dienecarbonyl-CoA hydratase
MNFQKIRLEFSHAESVANITLAAPKANVLDRAMIADLEAAFSQCAGHHLNAIVLGAAGPHFSFGASVQEHLPEYIAGTLSALHRLLRSVADAPAPVIAAVRGQCLGGGFELVLACDLIFAEESAQFACPEIKLGVFAPAASALLPARIGQAAAARLLLTGDSLTAAQAADLGLAARVVASNLEDAVEHWLETDFLPRSPSSLGFACRASRLGMRRALDQDLPQLESLYLRELMSTPDAVEGIRAFLDKRAPQWARAETVVQA